MKRFHLPFVFWSWLATTLLCLVAAPALAGTFFERGGAALQGYDPVAYFTDQRPVRGSPAFQAQYEGSTFHFASAANRDAFQREPARYAPQYGGFCAYGTARGYKAATDPAAFSVVDGKLYLNYNADVKREWSKDVPGYIGKADRNWPEVSRHSKVRP